MVSKLVVTLVLGYLIGSIPFGLIIGKLFRGVDVREYGSGNIGFANVLRTAGVKAGILTLLADVGKGALAAVIGGIIVGEGIVTIGALNIGIQGAQVMAAVMAMVGHNWSPYLRFSGGKGVDTALGGMIAMVPLVGIGCLAIGLAIIFGSRYVSMGSMLGAFSSVVILAPLVALDYRPMEFLIYGVAVTILIVFQHRENIARLRSGTERKLGQRGEKR